MSDETDLIKERLDLAEIVGEYVRLKRAGRHYKGLCPFHQEKTPSFVVSPDKGIWHCFGACSEGGDLFSFVQRMEGADFPTALKMLAERAGVELKSGRNERPDERTRLFDVLAYAARFYHEVLLGQTAGRKAQEYLRERGVKQKTMELFELGYAPHSWDLLQRYLHHKGFADDVMVAAGLVGRGQTGKLYDRFRGRIMFPIHDIQGRVVAFGGRIVPWHATGEEGKYVNSPETVLYEKRRVVYNLAKAKQSLRQQAQCLVVEGYLDVVMLVQAGWENVVASSGTAFTAEQIQQLARFTQQLHFAFDADAAGIKAAVSATQAALAEGMRVATIILPAGMDPAELALQHPQRLKECLGKPSSLVSVLLERLKGTQQGGELENSLNELMPLVAAVANPVYQGEMVQEIATALHVPESHIISQLQQAAERDNMATTQQIGEDPLTLEHQESSALLPEQHLLGLLILSPEVRADLFSEIDESFILDGDAKSLYNILQGLAQEAAFNNMAADRLLKRLPVEYLSYGEGLRVVSEERLTQAQGTPLHEGRAVLQVLKRRALEAKLKNLQGRLLRSDAKGRARVLQEFKATTERLSRIEHSGS